VVEKDARPLNFQTCIVRMRHGVYYLINKKRLNTEQGAVLETALLAQPPTGMEQLADNDYAGLCILG